MEAGKPQEPSSGAVRESDRDLKCQLTKSFQVFRLVTGTANHSQKKTDLFI